jgi:hypothetical protein
MMIPSSFGLQSILAALALVVVVSGCASDPPDFQWHKEGGTPEELAAAREHCMKEQEQRNRQDALKSSEQSLRKYYYNQCMNERGWYSSTVPDKAGEGE